MLQWSSVYLLLIICFYIPNVELQNFTTTSSTTEAIDFLSIDSSIYCKFQPNSYDCVGNGLFIPKFYYDLKLEGCKTSIVGSCPHNLNTFSTLKDCDGTCRDAGTHRIPRNLSLGIICRLQHDFGHCNGYYPKWYYDVTTRRCKGFSYSGCGGNMNRFPTQQICATACSGPMGV